MAADTHIIWSSNHKVTTNARSISTDSIVEFYVAKTSFKIHGHLFFSNKTFLPIHYITSYFPLINGAVTT